MNRGARFWPPTLTAWMGAGVCVFIAALTWFGYDATARWQDSSLALAERRAGEAADLLVTALSRDMRGVQTSVLRSPEWQRQIANAPANLGILVASAFARYPYPESFFTWRGTQAPDDVMFFNRSNRPPAFMPPADAARFPVTVGTHPEVGRRLAERIAKDAARGRRFSAFEMELGGTPYQIVASLMYRDSFGEQLEGVMGFTVNLPWVHRHYFEELTRQVARISSAEGLALAVTDEGGKLVTGRIPDAQPGASKRQNFTMLFLDPFVVALDPPPDLPRRQWAVQVGTAPDPTLAAAMLWSNQMLIVSALAAGALGLGVVMTARAARASARVSEMRSELVSTVTHELKTPIAAIRAAGDTLASGRISSAEAMREYAQLVVQESKRLTRLIDNLLAYARITDVTEAYSFTAVPVETLVDDALRAFSTQLKAGGFAVDVSMPAELPLVRADRTAIGLLLDNLIDNAIRYSGRSRSLQIRATAAADVVVLEVSDKGSGIPEDEVSQVVRKFVRGRRAGSSGSGLGLAIASRIVQDHGGRLTIRSIVDVGTTVGVTLPIASTHDEEAHPHR